MSPNNIRCRGRDVASSVKIRRVSANITRYEDAGPHPHPRPRRRRHPVGPHRAALEGVARVARSWLARRGAVRRGGPAAGDRRARGTARRPLPSRRRIRRRRVRRGHRAPEPRHRAHERQPCRARRGDRPGAGGADRGRPRTLGDGADRLERLLARRARHRAGGAGRRRRCDGHGRPARPRLRRRVGRVHRAPARDARRSRPRRGHRRAVRRGRALRRADRGRAGRRAAGCPRPPRRRSPSRRSPSPGRCCPSGCSPSPRRASPPSWPGRS